MTHDERIAIRPSSGGGVEPVADRIAGQPAGRTPRERNSISPSSRSFRKGHMPPGLRDA